MRADEVAAALDAGFRTRRAARRALRRVEARWSAVTDRTSRDALNTLVDWVGAVRAHVGAKGFVIGISGGVDSTLAAILVARAARDGSVAFMLPDGARDPESTIDAEALAQHLGLEVRTVDVARLVDAALAALGHAPDDVPVLMRGNLASRQRNALLYAEANATGRLVMGTGDLDETYIGYSSKGTTADLFPISGLHKGEVRALVHLGLEDADDALRARLAGKKASPGYYVGHDAERELGMSYDEIGRALDVIIGTCDIDTCGVVVRDDDRFAEALEQAGVAPERVLAVAELIAKNHHKAFGSPALWRSEPFLDDDGATNE